MTSSPNQPECRKADLAREQDALAVVAILDAYARDPMGGGRPLPEEVRSALPAALAARPGIHVLLAWQGGQAVGVAVCMEGFSTFACKPLLNLHDIAVLPASRRQGVASALLASVEQLARELGCCKVTLEVLSDNHAAQAAYRAAGFGGYQLDPAAGHALFWQKTLE